MKTIHPICKSILAFLCCFFVNLQGFQSDEPRFEFRPEYISAKSAGLPMDILGHLHFINTSNLPPEITRLHLYLRPNLSSRPLKATFQINKPKLASSFRRDPISNQFKFIGIDSEIDKEPVPISVLYLHYGEEIEYTLKSEDGLWSQQIAFIPLPLKSESAAGQSVSAQILSEHPLVYHLHFKGFAPDQVVKVQLVLKDKVRQAHFQCPASGEFQVPLLAFPVDYGPGNLTTHMALSVFYGSDQSLHLEIPTLHGTIQKLKEDFKLVDRSPALQKYS